MLGFGLACSQTLYFLFKVRRARVIKFKPEGIYWPPAQGGSGGGSSRALALLGSSPMFLKRTKRKMKQLLCTGYNPGQKGLGHCSNPLPFLVGNWWVTVNLQLSIWLCLGFPLPPPSPPPPEQSWSSYTYKIFQKCLASNTQHCPGGRGIIGECTHHV